jgi:hypothetical protein
MGAGGGEKLTGESRSRNGLWCPKIEGTAILEREPYAIGDGSGGVNGGAFPRVPKT